MGSDRQDSKFNWNSSFLSRSLKQDFSNASLVQWAGLRIGPTRLLVQHSALFLFFHIFCNTTNVLRYCRLFSFCSRMTILWYCDLFSVRYCQKIAYLRQIADLNNNSLLYITKHLFVRCAVRIDAVSNRTAHAYRTNRCGSIHTASRVRVSS